MTTETNNGVSKNIPLVGATIQIILYDLDPQIIDTFWDDFVNEAKRLEQIFNFYDPKSELSLLNNQRQKICSKELITVIKTALEYSHKTNGAYDVSKGLAFLDRKQGKTPRILHCSYKDIKLENSNSSKNNNDYDDNNNSNKITLLHPDVQIDLGSIAKGYIVDKLVEFLQEMGIENGFIDARGDMRGFGNHKEKIEIQHPRKQEEIIGTFILQNAAVATSGDYHQFHLDYTQSHIIGKRNIASATIVCSTAMHADVLATCAMVCDQKTTQRLLADAIAQGLLVTANLEQVSLEGMPLTSNQTISNNQINTISVAT